ncbi:maltose ABC transporter substrate-binding protein [Rathayibacter caricis]|uniref:sugar ABC transporter substrate-binding protein n=1 Tax=Rathayibacter caricis TaxID=110936 RepID=UPI001FB32548|nr:maltose ABC transporter substrate-binding protein [Rathayibacter caricis]MCJ1697995.1 maltose ABC transporter substrate-binding protein [Rathayibacter caricis]
MRTPPHRRSRRLGTATGSAVVAAGLALLLAGCSSPAPAASDAAGTEATASATEAPTRGDADLVIWANGPIVQALEPVVEKFGEEQGITVEVQAVATELQTNFVTANASGNGPDIVLGAHDWIGNLVQNGAIDPVQISADQAASFLPVAMDAVTYNGQTYGMPRSVESLILIRNKALAPDEPTSIENMLATGQAAVDAGTATRALNLQVGAKGDAYFMQPFYSSAGGYLFGRNADGSLNPDDLGVGQPGSIAAAEKIAALGDTGTGVLTQSVSSDNAIAQFTEGKIPFMINGPWSLGDIKKAGIDYGLSSIPGFEGLSAAQPFTGVQAFYVASNAKNKSFAQTFVQTVGSDPETERAIWEGDNLPPANTALVEELAAEYPDTKLAADAAAAGIPMPAIPEMAAIWAPLGQAEAAIVAGADPAATMTEAGSTITAALQ